MPARAYYRASRETWQIIVESNGKRIKAETTGRGEEGRIKAIEGADAHNERERSGREFLSAGKDDPLPIADLCDAYLTRYQHTFSHGFLITARGLVRNHIRPHFGSRDLRTLTDEDAVLFASAVVEKASPRGGEGSRISPAVAYNALSILRRVCTLHAKPRGVRPAYLPANPLSDMGKVITKMKRHRSEGVAQVDAWTLPELHRLLELARRREQAIYPVLVFLSHTGCRRGEALGLRWPSVSLGGQVVGIREAVVRGRVVAPKSGRARAIPLDAAGPLLLEVLAELAGQERPLKVAKKAAAKQRRRANGEKPARKPIDPAGIVFLGPDGLPWDESAFTKAWERLRGHFVSEGIRPLRLHDLRHTFASHALQAGCSVPQVSEWLGHASPEITLRVYSHVIKGAAPKGFLAQGAGLANKKETDEA